MTVDYAYSMIIKHGGYSFTKIYWIDEGIGFDLTISFD